MSPRSPGRVPTAGPTRPREWAQDLFDVSDQVSWANWEMQERGECCADRHQRGHPRLRGMDLGWRAWTVWRVRERMLAYYAGYSEREAALADFEGET